MIHKRSIVITEDENIIFRHDIMNINGDNIIELDIYRALKRLNNKKVIDIDKLFNIIKASKGLSVFDYFDVIKDTFIYKTDKWKIIPANEYDNYMKYKKITGCD